MEDRGSSPTDRVEKLLRKYKSRQAVRSSERLTTTETETLSKELSSWNLLNEELQLGGYQPVQFARPPASALAKDYLVVDGRGSACLRQTLLRLVAEVKRKDALVQDLLAALKTNRGYQPDVWTTPTQIDRPIRTPSGSHMTPDPLLQKLQSQLARLEYENAKLRVDLQNRPELKELRKCQKRVREVERELQQCKNLLSSEQLDLLQAQQQIKNVCSVLRVRSGEEVVPRISEMQRTIDSRDQLEKHLSAVLAIVYHPAAPRVALGDSPPRPSGHELWCEVTWGHVTLTLQEWLKHLRGLRELEVVFGEVCGQLEVVGGSCGDEDEEDGLVRGEGVLSMSCGEMATLLRAWLLRKGNMKGASTQALLAMVRHIQELFDVRKPEGLYTQMSRVYQQQEETRNVMKHLKSALHLDPGCPHRVLVSAVEGLASSESGQLPLQIWTEFGISDASMVLERLRQCEEFFPAFQTIVTEIQQFLGVDSLSAVVPALHQLQRTS